MTTPTGWMKHAGLGIELAGTTIGVAALGYAIDWKMQNKTQYATALFALIGFSFAMFRFIQNVSRENR
ncbi:AtpZ/AtpI family protein [Rubripirellula obstinata]|nr:AtpZ/AtpI family protein [Rubripirellula obstinata]